jgi:uncharacterized membrane protein YoaK (UPF0700 family)
LSKRKGWGGLGCPCHYVIQRNELRTIDAIVSEPFQLQNQLTPRDRRSPQHQHSLNRVTTVKHLSLPTLLSFNGGYVDTLGFLSLSGLFTAHVTGNFVTLGATMAHGLDGAWSKLLALPMFCAIVFLSRLACLMLQGRNRSPIRPMLVVKLMLLTAVAAMAFIYGPFNGDNSTITLVVALAMVSAMAIQNGLHKAHLAKAPPSTLMTGTTTQIMLDLADILASPKSDEIAAARARVKKLGAAVITFAVGCGAGAAGFMLAPVVAFSLPAILALIALFASSATAES